MDSLTEIQALKNFLGSLFGKSKQTAEFGEVGISSIEGLIKTIMKKIIGGFDGKVKRIDRKRRAEGLVLRYHVSIRGHEYVLKSYVVYESRYTIIDIWDKNEAKVLDVLATGDLRQKYRLRAMAKMRLKAWI